MTRMTPLTASSAERMALEPLTGVLERRLPVEIGHVARAPLVEEALDILDPAKVLGLVFNGDSRPLAGYYSYSAYRPYIAEPSVNGHSWSWRGRRGRDGARASSDGR